MKFSLKAVSILLVVSLFLASCASTKEVAKEAVRPEPVSTTSAVEQPQPVVSKPVEEAQPVENSEAEEAKQPEDVVKKQDVTVEEIYFGPRPAEKQEVKPLENVAEKPTENTAVNQDNNQVAVEQKEVVNTQPVTVQTQSEKTVSEPEESGLQGGVSVQTKSPSIIMLFVVAGVLVLGCAAGFVSKTVKKRKNS